MLEGLEQIQSLPKSGRRVPEQSDPLIRESLREPFRLIHEIHREELRILAVRRLERAALKPEQLRRS